MRVRENGLEKRVEGLRFRNERARALNLEARSSCII